MSSIKDFLGIGYDQMEHAMALHKKSIVVDNAKMDIEVWSDAQVEKLDEMLDAGKPFSSVSEAISKIRLDEMLTPGHPTRKKFAEQIKKSGVTGTSLSQDATTMERSLKSIARKHLLFDKLRDTLALATSVDDIMGAKKEGKLAVMLDFQNTLSIGMNLDNLDLFYGLGIRQIQLTYNSRTFAADGCTERTDAGLSYFGVAMIDRMNKLGILVDTGHVGTRSTMDAAEVSRDPIAISHSCCRSIHDHDRCKTDEAIKAVAERGGVMGVCAIPYFLAPIVGEADSYGRVVGGRAGNLKDMLDHIDYAVDLVGVDHVGIGSDTKDLPGCPERWEEARASDRKSVFRGWRPEHKFDYGVYSEAGVSPSPDKLLAWSNWPNKTIGLVSRGYSDKEVEKIIGGNWLRLYKKVIG